MANLGLQNNNPGNLKDPATGVFRQFASPEEGYQALTNDIKIKQSGQSKVIKPGASISDFANVWAPSSDNNNPLAYANTLATHLGVDPSTPFDKVPADKLAGAIQVAEGTSTMPNISTPTPTTPAPKLSVDDFAAKIKAKYPGAYDDMDNSALTQKILAKYPQYQDMVDLTQPATPSSPTATPTTPDDLLNNPITRAIQNVFPGKEVGQSIGTLADYAVTAVKEKLGLVPKGTTDAYDLSAPTPLQVGGDIAQGALMVGGGEALEGGIAADTVAGRIGQAAVGGSAYGGANAIAEGSTDMGEIGKRAAIGGLAGAATGGLIEAGGAGINALKGLGGKTAAEILATPESEVSKLSSSEQKLWYKTQADAARANATDLTAKATQAGIQSTKEITNEIQNLNQQIGQSTRDEAIALKPKAQQVMRDASQEYLSLTGEAVENSPALSKTMSHEDLSAKIDSKFEYDPQIATSLKEDLGIKSPSSTPIPEGETPKPQTITNQDILDKARAIMQDVSKSARTGNKVYSPQEYEAMKKYSFLMETLGDNGVDMSAANKFWREYAPVRDRMVREIKPFDETNTGKMPITSTINTASSVANTSKQAASQLDAQNFIKELETRMKLPEGSIGSDTKDLVSQLEKAKVSKTDMAQATKDILAKIKEDKTEALRTMTLNQYNTQRIARNRKIIKIAIASILGVGALKTVPVVGPVVKAVAGAL